MSSQPPQPPSSGSAPQPGSGPPPWQQQGPPPGQQPPPGGRPPQGPPPGHQPPPGQQPPPGGRPPQGPPPGQPPGHQPPPGGFGGPPPYQGQGGPQWGQPEGESGGFFQTLFDFSFSKFITLTFAKILFILIIVLAALIWLVYIIAGFASGEAVVGVMAILFGWIPAFLMILFYRVGLEFVVANIRTAQNTGELVEATNKLVEQGKGK